MTHTEVATYSTNHGTVAQILLSQWMRYVTWAFRFSRTNVHGGIMTVFPAKHALYFLVILSIKLKSFYEAI